MAVINGTRKDKWQKSRVLLHFVTHSRCRRRHVSRCILRGYAGMRPTHDSKQTRELFHPKRVTRI